MAGRTKPTFDLVCDICGRPFRSTNARRKRCSAECDMLAKESLRKKQGLEKHERIQAKRRRMVRDGVPESVREKVVEAMRLGISYGKLQALRSEAARRKAMGNG